MPLGKSEKKEAWRLSFLAPTHRLEAAILLAVFLGRKFNQNKRMKKYLIGLSVLIAALIGVAFFFEKPQQAIAGLAGGVANIAGTRAGTTTTSAFFSTLGQTASTSQVLGLEKGEADLAVLTFRITGASSTPNGRLTWAVFGSNDASCNTATTTTTMDNTVITSNITWYSLGSGSEGQITATGAVATGTITTFTNLVFECLRVDVNGSSTSALVQARSKNSQ